MEEKKYINKFSLMSLMPSGYRSYSLLLFLLEKHKEELIEKGAMFQIGKRFLFDEDKMKEFFKKVFNK